MSARDLRAAAWPHGDAPPFWRRVAVLAAHAISPAFGEATKRREVVKLEKGRSARKAIASETKK